MNFITGVYDSNWISSFTVPLREILFLFASLMVDTFSFLRELLALLLCLGHPGTLPFDFTEGVFRWTRYNSDLRLNTRCVLVYSLSTALPGRTRHAQIEVTMQSGVVRGYYFAIGAPKLSPPLGMNCIVQLFWDSCERGH